MNESLKHKTLRGLFWSGIDQFGLYFVRFGFSIWIARLLSPRDYGLIGMITIFIMIAQTITDSGLQTAIIQKKSPDEKDYSTVFFFNIIMGILFYIIIYLTAGEIALFFNEPALKLIARVVSLSLIIGPFTSIQLTRLSKIINFKKQAKINFISTIAAGTTGLFMAYNDFAVWALVFQSLSGVLIRSILLWTTTNWYPLPRFSFSTFKKLYAFGWKIFVQRMIGTISRNLYYPTIGKVFDTNILGFYTRAKRFQELVVIQFSIFFQRVIFPAFSNIQYDYKKIYNNAISGFSILVFFLPILVVILISTVRPFVLLLLTDKWADIIPYLKILYLEGLFYPIYVFNMSILNSLGFSGKTLKSELLMRILTFTSIPIGLLFGIYGLLISIIIVSFLGFLISSYYLNQMLNNIFIKQVKLVLYPILLAFIIYLFINTNIIFQLNNNLLLLSIRLLFGIIIYYYIAKILKLKNYRDFYNLLNNYISNNILKYL